MAPPGYPYPHYFRPPPTSAAAVSSLVFGLIGLVIGWCTFAIPSLIAVICGHIGLIATRDSRKTGRGMAVAGLILGYLLVLPVAALLLLAPTESADALSDILDALATFIDNLVA